MDDRPLHVRYVVKSGERILSLYPNLKQIVDIYSNVRIEIETWVDNGALAPIELVATEKLTISEAAQRVTEGLKRGEIV